ncbi:polysaccharide biosynthesis tyrosine autokinase [Blastococcus tunisiensis]|uniref:Capsular exopolysaccharide family n=1 Tax=Blastococcus tunisiensis TaxID=1798228 RepID=A0A1I2K9J6_9ACTN|nr:polysaccharide biosynthesis tyrosine autokinase [Blastococcus sp. DSM 46838]SFF61606.1 capsular exopolysaccharide family [Blastococcus sp. DSM 46838]
MNLKDVLQALRSGWWLVFAVVLVGTATAGALTLTATPLYSSTTKLFVSTSSTPDSSAAYTGNLFSQQRVTSYAELLSGVQLAAAVVEELDLPLTPEEVAEKVTASPVPDTVILTVTVTDSSAPRAQDIAASLGRQFAEQVTQLETPAGAEKSTIKVTTVQPADYREAPVSPDLARNLGLGIVLGLLMGIGLALVRSRLDNTVKLPTDVIELTGVGVIGTVLEDARLADEHMVTELDQHSRVAEAYRAIRTNLQFLDVDNPPRVIVVSSSIPGEGKSTLAVNLATVLAQSGSRVTLIEADLRRPRVTKYMGLISGAGLSNVLGGTAALYEVTQPWGDGRLSVLGAGPMPPNPSEMLGSANMRSLLEHLRQTNDFVLIDAPPLLPVTDAAVLTAQADGCLLSVRYGKTRREELAEAAATLGRIDGKLLGVVLNRVPQAAAATRGYGYSYGYEADAGRATTAGASSSRLRPGTPAPGSRDVGTVARPASGGERRPAANGDLAARGRAAAAPLPPVPGRR